MKEKAIISREVEICFDGDHCNPDDCCIDDFEYCFIFKKRLSGTRMLHYDRCDECIAATGDKEEGFIVVLSDCGVERWWTGEGWDREDKEKAMVFDSPSEVRKYMRRRNVSEWYKVVRIKRGSV